MRTSEVLRTGRRARYVLGQGRGMIDTRHAAKHKAEEKNEKRRRIVVCELGRVVQTKGVGSVRWYRRRSGVFHRLACVPLDHVQTV
jgi:hypothetical protein